MLDIVTATHDTDRLRWNAVRNAVDPRHGIDDSTFLARLDLPGERIHLLAFDSTGDVVAVGQSGRGAGATRVGIDVFHVPDTGTSFGDAATALVDELEEWATSRTGAKRLTAWAYDHADDQREFWETRGWVQSEVDIAVGIDPTDVTPPDIDAQPRIVTLADRPDLWPDVYDVYRESWTADAMV